MWDISEIDNYTAYIPFMENTISNRYFARSQTLKSFYGQTYLKPCRWCDDLQLKFFLYIFENINYRFTFLKINMYRSTIIIFNTKYIHINAMDEIENEYID